MTGSEPTIRAWIETAQNKIKASDLDQVIIVCGVTEDEAIEMHNLLKQDQAGRMPAGQRSARAPGGHLAAVPEHFRQFTDLEPTAKTIMAVHGERIPGLLQSEHYMLTQFQAADISGPSLTQLILNRRARKRILDQPTSPYLHVVLGEGAFYRMPGGRDPQVLLDQIEHLIEVMDGYPRVFLYLLPFDAALPYMPEDFTIMEFADGTTDFVYIEYLGGAQHVEDPKRVEGFIRKWNELRDCAYSRKRTRSYLTALAQRCRAELVGLPSVSQVTQAATISEHAPDTSGEGSEL